MLVPESGDIKKLESAQGGYRGAHFQLPSVIDVW